MVALGGHHRQIDAGRDEQDEPEAVGEDEHGQAPHRPHGHHLEIVRLREGVVDEGAAADGEVDIETDGQADQGDQRDDGPIDGPSFNRFGCPLLRHLVGPPGAEDEGDEREVGEEHGPGQFVSGDLVAFRLTGIHDGRAADELPGTPGHGIAVEEQIHRQGVPEGAALHDE